MEYSGRKQGCAIQENLQSLPVRIVHFFWMADKHTNSRNRAISFQESNDSVAQFIVLESNAADAHTFVVDTSKPNKKILGIGEQHQGSQIFERIWVIYYKSMLYTGSDDGKDKEYKVSKVGWLKSH